jgi:hypothetical protein
LADPNYFKSELPFLYEDIQILQKHTAQFLYEKACRLSARSVDRRAEQKIGQLSGAGTLTEGSGEREDEVGR